jgi:hypothetical protein
MMSTSHCRIRLREERMEENERSPNYVLFTLPTRVHSRVHPPPCSKPTVQFDNMIDPQEILNKTRIIILLTTCPTRHPTPSTLRCISPTPTTKRSFFFFFFSL